MKIFNQPWYLVLLSMVACTHLEGRIDSTASSSLESLSNETIRVEHGWRVYYTDHSVSDFIDTNDTGSVENNSIKNQWVSDKVLVGDFSRYASTGLVQMDQKEDVLMIKNHYLFLRDGGSALSTQNLIGHIPGLSLEQALFGDFDGDGTKEFLQSFMDHDAPQKGKGSGWYIVSGEYDNKWIKINDFNTNTQEAKAGDFNGDGFCDAMTLMRDGWYVAFGGPNQNLKSWHKVQSTSLTMREVAIGDFNGDGRDDVFFTQTDDMSSGWFLVFGAEEIDTEYDKVKISNSSIRFEKLRFGDFNGDGKEDILTYLGRKEAEYMGYYVAYIDQPDVWERLHIAYCEKGIDYSIVGDFNGDGKDDVIDTYMPYVIKDN